MGHRNLIEYFRKAGLRDDQFWIGPEHPDLERFALELLSDLPGRRVLEIGFQAGGFAVPIIETMQSYPDFSYLGVDDGRYKNSVSGRMLSEYLVSRSVKPDVFGFVDADAKDFLLSCKEKFDLILLDHAKPLYPRELRLLLSRNIIAPAGGILLHDIEGKASGVWPICQTMAKRFGCTSALHPEIPAGLAVVYCPEAGLLSAQPGDRLFVALLKAKHFLKRFRR